MNDETNNSEGKRRSQNPSCASSPPSKPTATNGPPCNPEIIPGDPKIGKGETSNDQFIAELKRNVEAYRLPPELREHILAELLPPEEHERLFREMQEKGGLSFKQLVESLGLEVHPES